MADQMITCPSCGVKIPLTEAFTHDIEEKLRSTYERARLDREQQYKNAIAAKEKEHAATMAAAKKDLEQQARKAAEEELQTKLTDMSRQLEEGSKKLRESREKELQFLKRERELEEKEANMKLEVERKLSEQSKKIREDVSGKMQEEYRLKEKEKDMQLDDMRKQIEDLRRKAEQGSQQSQGEALEVELEELLRTTFPLDTIEPVAKGVKGADVVQKVMSKNVQDCGSILWETKRTKAWSDGWLQKLKDDQRMIKAEVAVIISAVLPKGVERFGFVDGVWVTDLPSAIGLAMALRTNLIDLMQMRSSLAGKSEKMELLYSYLLGNEFKGRVEAIVEAFVAMKDDLDAEKRATEKAWAKRDKLIHKVLQNTAGMHGDLQGIIGASLPQIKQLEMGENE